MKNWYKSAFCKGMLILTAHISFAAVVVCLVTGAAYPGQNYGDLLLGNHVVSYDETAGFANQMWQTLSDIIEIIRVEENLGINGEKDLGKEIEIKVGDEEETADKAGKLSFKLKDLIKASGSSRRMLVCRRPEKIPEGELRYQYYLAEQLPKLIRENGWQFREELPYSEKEMFRMMENEDFIPDDGLLDKDGNVLYEKIWLSDQIVDTELKTADGKTIQELVNTSAAWNGKFTKICDTLENERYNIQDSYENYRSLKSRYKEGENNVSYLFINHGSGTLKTNRKAYASEEKAEESVRSITKKGKYVRLTSTLEGCETNMKPESADLAEMRHTVDMTVISDGADFDLVFAVNTDYPIQDLFYVQNTAYEKYMPLMEDAVVIGAGALLLFLVCLIWLTAEAGRSNYEDGISLVFFDKWKTEIGLCLIAALIGAAVGLEVTWIGERLFIDWNPWYAGYAGQSITTEMMLEAVGVSLCSCAAFLTGYLSLVRRIKAKTLWQNSILRWLLRSLSYIYRNRSSLTKGLIVGCVLFLVNLLMMSQSGFLVLQAVIVDALAVLFMLKRQIDRERIKKGVSRIANGDTEYKIPLENLTGDNREMAEQVNRIGEGIQNAVEKSLKDERLKTDLITNVSHDIKTPLTSIINYVGLLKQEQFEDPKIQRYLDVLDQKSQRLKTLTEDVVEASKISSGNINLELINLNLVEMIRQTTGEFAEKFEKKNLQMVLDVPDYPLVVKADGRRMWRVIENIYNNAAKYAMPGTRVYADLTADGKTVCFSLKNVSECPLNIRADELTERFIRGDISRSTEGSGLGLSIAKNLTEMQGGEFKLYVDGDLFKVRILFPQIVREEMVIS